MRPLGNHDRATWDYFMEGNFCCQKNDIHIQLLVENTTGNKKTKHWTRRVVWSIKQLKQHKSLLHDCSYSIENILKNTEGWRGIEF